MKPQARKVQEIRAELIKEILLGVEEIGERKPIADRLGMTTSNLNYHLQVDGPYTNNVKKLGEIATVVSEIVLEKRKEAEEALLALQQLNS